MSEENSMQENKEHDVNFEEWRNVKVIRAGEVFGFFNRETKTRQEGIPIKVLHAQKVKTRRGFKALVFAEKSDGERIKVFFPYSFVVYWMENKDKIKGVLLKYSKFTDYKVTKV